MPGIKAHCIQAALTSAAVYPFAGGANAAVFGLSIVLIDIDHVIEYVRQTGSPKIWGVFPCCQIIMSNVHRGFYVLNLFHTIEFMLLLGVLGLLQPVLFYILAGLLWHCSLDLFMLARHRFTCIRAFSIVEYCIKSRNPANIVRIRDLLRIDGLTIPQDSWNYPAWIQHWAHCRPFC
jgi:hypothetical protein